MATSYESGNVNKTSRNSADSPTSHASAWDQKALEITLHDGLDRLEDFALMMALHSQGSQFEILSITPPPISQKASSPHTPSRTHETVVNIREVQLKKSA